MVRYLNRWFFKYHDLSGSRGSKKLNSKPRGWASSSSVFSIFFAHFPVCANHYTCYNTSILSPLDSDCRSIAISWNIYKEQLLCLLVYYSFLLTEVTAPWLFLRGLPFLQVQPMKFGWIWDLLHQAPWTNPEQSESSPLPPQLLAPAPNGYGFGDGWVFIIQQDLVGASKFWDICCKHRMKKLFLLRLH